MAEMFFPPSSNHYGRAKREPKWKHEHGETLFLIDSPKTRICMVRGRWVPVKNKR